MTGRRAGESHRNPPVRAANWSVRAPLAAWVHSEADALRARGMRARVLDVGCGAKPYEPYFAGVADVFVGVDVEVTPYADLVGTVEALPVDDASFDVVLCNQVLEHCDDPAQAVRELRRVTAPGGRVLASTHGVQVYHPAPNDLWRWTHEGLERLFTRNGDWASVTVHPGAGSAACLAMLAGHFLWNAGHRARALPLTDGLTWCLNRGAAALDARVRALREPGPGTVFANYHVTAVVPA